MRLGRERPRKRVERAERASEIPGRFNEAGARTPQKEGRRGDYWSHRYAASMRLGRERPRKVDEAVTFAGVTFPELQ